MKARRLIENKGKYDIVYFGSKGLKGKIVSETRKIITDEDFSINPYLKPDTNNIIKIKLDRIKNPKIMFADDWYKIADNRFYRMSLIGSIFIFTDTQPTTGNEIHFDNFDEGGQYYLSSGFYTYYLHTVGEVFVNTQSSEKPQAGTDEYYCLGEGFYIRFTFQVLKNNIWEEVVKVFYSTKDDENNYVCEIDLNEILNEYPNEIISNVKLKMQSIAIIDQKIPIDLSIEYLENSGDLVQPDLDRNDKDYYNQTIKSDYSEKQEGVRDSLIARLDLIKGELWYRSSYGLPLLEKVKSKGIYDSIIVGYITDHPDVVNIESFSSKVNGHSYEFECVINTVYNEQITVSNKI